MLMTQLNKSIRRRWIVALSLALVLVLGAVIFAFPKPPLLIAPMIGGLNSCIFKKQDLMRDTQNALYTQLCIKDPASASQLIEATLGRISAHSAAVGNYQLGYTLYVPLLQLFDIRGAEFQLNKDALARIAHSIKNVDRPVVLYLFSDHFEVKSPVEERLAQNPENLLHSKKGPMPLDRYYGSQIYPWSFADTKNDITRLREIAFNAVLDEVCNLPVLTQKRVAGVTMLGELHHMFPDFQGGMGFAGDYVISDYSAKSAKDFSTYLANRYKLIQVLNLYLGSSFASFQDIQPPSKDIRNEPLKHYWEHMDAYAHGVLPISGWVAAKVGEAHTMNWIHLYDNGTFLGKAPVAFGRQDVLAAHPDIGSPDVGWQFNWNYANATPGLHKIDILLEHGRDPLVLLESRQVAVMERSQASPRALEVKPLPHAAAAQSALLFNVDTPANLTSYYFNPLALLWHDFRKHQVSNYLEHFAKIAKSKCINPDLIYSHQILPFANPGWDESKFGVGRDLAVPANVRLGISLYGEASYGTSFFDWFKGTQRSAYGITEFHPLKAMDPKELNTVFDRHYQNNAQFLSFFVESVGLDEDPKNKPNIFSFDPMNKNAGSDVLYQSVKEILH